MAFFVWLGLDCSIFWSAWKRLERETWWLAEKIKRYLIRVIKNYSSEQYFILTAFLAKLPKWFGERPGKKSGDPESPEQEEAEAADALEVAEDEPEEEVEEEGKIS